MPPPPPGTDRPLIAASPRETHAAARDEDTAPPRRTWPWLHAALRGLESRSKATCAAISVLLVLLIGVIDYISGYEIYFSAFYLLPVALAAWFVGGAFGMVVSVLSVLVWLSGDIAAGAPYSTVLVPIWNAGIALLVYGVVVWTLASLRALQRELEQRVRQRTMALSNEMQERERLQQELMEIGERERRRIGHDLHDTLCQHWAATAMAGQVLGEKLAARSAAEAEDARAIVRLIGEGLAAIRSLSHTLSPVEMEADGLNTALSTLAESIRKMSTIDCSLVCDDAPLIHDDAMATHLYRIAQESINNAIRHGRPSQIVIGLSSRKERGQLTIEDNGVGLAEDWQARRGLGTRIMIHRASLIGGAFSIGPNPTGGTLATCTFPLVPRPVERQAETQGGGA